MQILHCPTAAVKRKVSCSFRFKLFPHGDVSLVILLFLFPSFLPSSRTSLSGLAAASYFSFSSSSRICTLSPSFQVIDVLSLRRIHQHGGGILRRSEEASQEGLANNSALSSFLSGVADVLSSPSFLPDSGPICRFGGGHGLHGSLDCQVRHHPSGPLPASAQQRSLSGIFWEATA